MSLQDEIDRTRSEIRTDGYSMSISEWISLYEQDEIDIHPEFQRFFRWTDSQKSTFIESILLGIPIPPIFVSQRDDGVWDVVDGLQRLSTIYQFAGILKDENGETAPPLVLQAARYLPSLDGKLWDNPDDPENSLTRTQRLLLKRAKITVSIIQRESDEMAKYELFQRLNTGGSIATPQEVRNCILVMLNPELYRWMRTLADYEPFRQCIALSDRLYEQQYDVELVLRFLIVFDLPLNELSDIKDIGDFLTDRMVALAQIPNLDLEPYEHAFHSCFDALARSTQSDSFRRYAVNQDKFTGGFLLSAYEVIALGLGYNHLHMPADSEISQRVKSIWSHATYTNWSGSGITAMRRLPRIVPLGRGIFRHDCQNG